MNPIVSICCITYNHEKYIRDAIEGFLMQKTNFTFEILIHDDASTDKTAEIVREYEQKYPQLIKPIYQTENQYSKGINPGVEFLFPRARGKYIALCEGDDYWIDPLKLQKQVDFLEANPEFGLVYTNFITVDENKKKIKKQLRRKPIHPIGRVTKYFQKRNFIQTVTVLARKELLIKANYLASYHQFRPIDYAMFIELSGLTQFYYFPDKTSAYRVLKESLSHTGNINTRIAFVENSFSILRYYNTKFNWRISKKQLQKRYTLLLLREYSLYKDKKMFFSTLKSHIKNDISIIFCPLVYFHLMILFHD